MQLIRRRFVRPSSHPAFQPPLTSKDPSTSHLSMNPHIDWTPFINFKNLYGIHTNSCMPTVTTCSIWWYDMSICPLVTIDAVCCLHVWIPMLPAMRSNKGQCFVKARNDCHRWWWTGHALDLCDVLFVQLLEKLQDCRPDKLQFLKSADQSDIVFTVFTSQKPLSSSALAADSSAGNAACSASSASACSNTDFGRKKRSKAQEGSFLTRLCSATCRFMIFHSNSKSRVDLFILPGLFFLNDHRVFLNLLCRCACLKDYNQRRTRMAFFFLQLSNQMQLWHIWSSHLLLSFCYSFRLLIDDLDQLSHLRLRVARL